MPPDVGALTMLALSVLSSSEVESSSRAGGGSRSSLCCGVSDLTSILTLVLEMGGGVRRYLEEGIHLQVEAVAF